MIQLDLAHHSVGVQLSRHKLAEVFCMLPQPQNTFPRPEKRIQTCGTTPTSGQLLPRVCWRRTRLSVQRELAGLAPVLSSVFLLICFGVVIYLVGRHILTKLQNGNEKVTVELEAVKERATTTEKLARESADSLHRVQTEVARIADRLERTSTDRALSVLDHVEAVGVTVKKSAKTDRELRSVANDVAQQISDGFSSFSGIPVKACIKLLEKPSNAVGDWNGKWPVEKIFISRIGAWPVIPAAVESRIPLTDSFPLQQLYMV